MTTLLAVGLSLAIPLASSIAPLVHVHGDVTTAHHEGRTVHAHFSGHSHSHHTGHGPAVTGADRDGAVFLQAFVAVVTTTLGFEVGLTPSFAPPAVLEAASQRSVLVTHTHDPPYLRSLSTRAPPTVLS